MCMGKGGGGGGGGGLGLSRSGAYAVYHVMSVDVF